MGQRVEYRSTLLRWLHRRPKEWGKDPGAFDPERVRALHARLGAVFGPGRWFEIDATGWENLPPAPVMLVGNHSGGTSIPDVWGLLYAWIARFGTDRVIHPLGHEMIFFAGITGRPFSDLGVLRAHPERAREVLLEWKRDLLVLPGGDVDTWRPFSARYQVRFGGRTGYARLALETGTPIVPVAHAGAHETLLVLTAGGGLARRLHLPELARAEIFPISLALPWGLAIGPLPHLPVPVRLRYRIGQPVQVPEGEVTDEAVAEVDRRVRAAIQQLLDQLQEDRPRLRDRLRATRRRLRHAVGVATG